MVGVYHGEADGAKVYFDEKYKAFQQSLDKAIPDAYNQIVNFTDDEKNIFFLPVIRGSQVLLSRGQG